MTGAGSGVGQGVIKSLHASSLALNVVSADISPFNTGLYRTSESILIPKVEDSGAREEISENNRKKQYRYTDGWFGI